MSLQKMKLSLLLLVCLAWVALVQGTAQPRRSWCNPTSPAFVAQHAAQLGSMTTDPLNIYWKANVTIMANFVIGQTTYVDVANYVYAQRTTYSRRDCCWFFDQAYERVPGSGVVNMVRVKSCIPGPNSRDYQVAWVTKPLFDQQLVAALSAQSRAFTKDSLFSLWSDDEDRDIYDEVIKIRVPNQDRYYSNNFYDDATGLTFWGYLETQADNEGFFPSYFKDAFAAFDAGTLTQQPDLAGFPFGIYDYLVPTYVRPGAAANSRSTVDLASLKYDPRGLPARS